MLKRTGNAKLIDIGSAFEWAEGSRRGPARPAYAAPEVLEGDGGSPQSDLASLGYVLVEMLAGAPPFAGLSTTATSCSQAKRTIVDRLAEILPEDVVCNELLMNLIGGLIAPDPARPVPERRGCRPRRAGGGQLPPPARPRQPRQRVRQRDPRLARRAGLRGYPGRAWRADVGWVSAQRNPPRIKQNWWVVLTPFASS